MNTVSKVGAFGAGLVLTFGAAFWAGHAAGPIASGTELAHRGHAESAEQVSKDGNGAHGAGHTAVAGEAIPGGLRISERGYTLAPPVEPLPVGTASTLRFRIMGPDGTPVTRYTRSHDKDLHLIVVRRDLSGFQHVHPVLGADGTWQRRR